MKTTGSWTGPLLFILAAASFCWRLAEPNTRVDIEQASPLDSAVLGPADKAEIAEILRLKTELGDQVWPGLSRIEIPLILFNERYEFLVEETNPPSPWVVVKGDDFLGRPYFRRPAGKPQAFAVAVGAGWAGSIGLLELMNRQILFRLSREFHAVLMLHEVFHALQATLAPQHFAEAMSAYKFESRYPYQDSAFSAAWTSEGEVLADALRATGQEAISGLARRFLEIREARRRQTFLDPELVSYETALEWLEGLAKYAEVRFYELAASRASEAAYAGYRSGHPFWLADLGRLRRSLGEQEEDLRFYLSGAAQAMLLDRLCPGWKTGAFGEKASLEVSLRAAIIPRCWSSLPRCPRSS